MSVEGLRKRVERIRKGLGVSEGPIKVWRGKRVVTSRGWNEWKPGAFKVFPDRFVPIFGEVPEDWMNDWIDLLVKLKDHGLGRWRCFDCVIKKASELRVEVEERRRLRDENRGFYERELTPEKRVEFERQDRLKVAEYMLYNDVGGVEGRVCALGEETRDFTFVEDIVDGTLRIGVVKEAVGEAVNLASETETRVIDLANWINELAGNDAGMVFKRRRDWDKVVKRRASIEKARKILGYEPKVNIRTGLKRTYEWVLKNKERIEQVVEF